MPIIFVHGVANRDDSSSYQKGLQSIQRYLQEYVYDAISPSDPTGVRFIAPYWGGVAAQFAWNRTSCPRGSILGMGSTSSELETALLLAQDERLRASLRETETRAPDTVLLPQGAQPEKSSPALDLSDLSSVEISDLAATLINELNRPEAEKASLAITADQVAHDPAFLTALKLRTSPLDQAELFVQHLQARTASSPVGIQGYQGVLGMGAWDRFKDGLAETLSRATSLPGAAATKVLSEARMWLNGFITLFLGDVFTYIGKRGAPSQPGPIPSLILAALRQAKEEQVKRNGEPIVVLTHSMGGQLIYEMATAFLPAIKQEGIRIDFWCATASQVALFEEMKLFIASDSKYCAANHNKAPYPPSEFLGAWWNVWDANDFISFTAKDIFEGVLDESYDSGLSVAEAHGGYLKRPSFYRKLAERIQESRQKGWK
jgi:hypothetical protein